MKQDRVSSAATLLRLGLRVQRPLLMALKQPQQLAMFEYLVKKVIHLPKKTIQVDSPRHYVHIHNQAQSARPEQILVYIHGGGYSLGSPETHKMYAARLMQLGHFAQLYMPRYRLAPQHPFPAGLDDVEKFWLELLKQHQPDNIVLAGESAGAGLCIGLCLRAREQGLAMPKRIFLHSAWLDVSMSGESYLDRRINDAFFGRGRFRRRWINQMFAQPYIGAGDAKNPMMSPAYADLTGLPPVLLQVGSDEVFLTDSQRFSAAAKQANVICKLEVWPQMWHAFAVFAPILPEANQAMKIAAKWLRSGYHQPRRDEYLPH